MGSDVLISLAAATAKRHLHPEDSVEELVRNAFAHSNDHGMALKGDESNFLGAVAAVLGFCKENGRSDDMTRLRMELEQRGPRASLSIGPICSLDTGKNRRIRSVCIASGGNTSGRPRNRKKGLDRLRYLLYKEIR